jgi:hypothetical protein
VNKIYLEWTSFKLNVTSKSAIRYVEKDAFYVIFYGEFESSIMKNGSESANQADFETNYKSLANKSITSEVSPFTSKKIGVKNLFNRTHGVSFALVVGANTLEYTIPYTICKITGAEVVNGEIGDCFDFYVVHPTNGVLGQFAYTNYVAKDFYARISSYDADLAAGLILRCVYNSISSKGIYINFLLHEVV